MINLYHGTTKEGADSIIMDGIDLSANIHPGDFGRGFYLAPHIKQVQFHATKRRRGMNTSKGVILHYEIENNIMNCLSPLEFKFKTYDWGEMIYQQRVLEKDTNHNIIIGPIADGSIPGIIESCKAGIITKQDFIRAAAMGELGIQYVFKTKKAVEKLKFVEIIKEW